MRGLCRNLSCENFVFVELTDLIDLTVLRSSDLTSRVLGVGKASDFGITFPLRTVSWRVWLSCIISGPCCPCPLRFFLTWQINKMQETINRRASKETTITMGRSCMVDRGCAKAATLKEKEKFCDSSGLIRPGLEPLRDMSSTNGVPESGLGQSPCMKQGSRSQGLACLTKTTLTEAVHSCRHFARKMARQKKKKKIVVTLWEIQHGQLIMHEIPPRFTQLMVLPRKNNEGHRFRLED